MTINNATGEIRGFMPSRKLKEGVVQDLTAQDPFCRGKAPRSMCVGTNDSRGDAFCLGDAGSGLFYMQNGRKFMLAVASMPTPEMPKRGARNPNLVKLCTKGTRAARISNYMAWIQRRIGSEHCKP